MGLLGLFSSQKENGRNVLSADDKALIEANIKLCEDSCEGCSGGEDVSGRDQKVFEKLKLDREQPLLGSSVVSRIHFIVPTSKSDWAHDACREKKGSVQDRITSWIEGNESKYAGKEGTKIRCNVSSQRVDMLDVDVMRGRKNTILVLPHFVRLVGIRADSVEEVLTEVVPDLLSNNMDALLGREYVEECSESSFVFICSHSKRDSRCGVTAPILQRYFHTQLQQYGLYRDSSDDRPDGCEVTFVNHVGGHKFAANVLIYLKRSRTLVWLARVSPAHVGAIVKYLIAAAEPELPFPEKVRCVKKYDF